VNRRLRHSRWLELFIVIAESSLGLLASWLKARIFVRKGAQMHRVPTLLSALALTLHCLHKNMFCRFGFCHSLKSEMRLMRTLS